MATEKILIFDEAGNAKRMKVRIARFLDNEPVTAADKTNIRTTLDVDDSLSGTFTTPLSVTSASDSSFTGGGNVGIGTASPNTLLECYDTVKPVIRLSGSGNDADGTNYGSIEFYNRDASIDGPNVGAQIHVESSSVNGAGGELVFSTERSSSEGEGSAPLERVRIDDSGRVGIGTGVPPQKLTVQGGGVQIAGAISSPASGVSALLLDWVSSNSRYWSRGADATTQGTHNFYVLENDGGNQVNALEINASGLKFPVSGLGIDFGSAATSAGQGTGTTGTPANSVLSDYEYGSWVPTFKTDGTNFATMTMDVLQASYVKFGRQVICQAMIRTSNVDITGATGVVVIDGLPFVSDSTTDSRGTCTVGQAGNWVNKPTVGFTETNTTQVKLMTSGGAGYTGHMTPSDFTTGATPYQNQMMFSVFYIATT